MGQGVICVLYIFTILLMYLLACTTLADNNLTFTNT